MGLGEWFLQPVVFSPVSLGSPQPVGASLGFPQAAVPSSTVGLVGEVPAQPDGPRHVDKEVRMKKSGRDIMRTNTAIFLNEPRRRLNFARSHGRCAC